MAGGEPTLKKEVLKKTTYATTAENLVIGLTNAENQRNQKVNILEKTINAISAEKKGTYRRIAEKEKEEGPDQDHIPIKEEEENDREAEIQGAIPDQTQKRDITRESIAIVPAEVEEEITIEKTQKPRKTEMIDTQM